MTRALSLKLVAADRAATCAEHISAEGEVVNTRSGPREHPLLKTELANRAFAVRTLHRDDGPDYPQAAGSLPPKGEDARC